MTKIEFIIGRREVKKLLTIGRMDKSGDFTPGVGLTEEQAETILTIAFCAVKFDDET